MHVIIHCQISSVSLAEDGLLLDVTWRLVPWDYHTVLCVYRLTDRIFVVRSIVQRRPIFSGPAKLIVDRRRTVRTSNTSWNSRSFVSVEVGSSTDLPFVLVRNFNHADRRPCSFIGAISITWRFNILLSRLFFFVLDWSAWSHYLVRNQTVPWVINIVRPA